MRTIPLTIGQATLTLYAADALGNPLLDAPVWMGSRIEGVELQHQFGEVESTPTGASFPEHELLGEYHEIRIERIWAVPLDTFRDYQLTRQGCVMVIAWRDEESGTWQRRTYYGVKGRAYNFKSTDWKRMALLTDQMFRARSMVSEGGMTGSDGEELPEATTVREQALAYTFDDAIAPGDYLLDVYQFRAPVRIDDAVVIGRCDGGGVTLQLELNGVLQAETLVLPAAAGEQTAQATFDRLVPANTALRWQAVAGGGASLIGLTMNVTES
jgi:hypothetical protein